MKQSVLVLVFSNLKHDARVMRHLQFLRKKYQVTVACLDANPDSADEVIILQQQRLTLFRKAITACFLLARVFPVAYRLLYPYHYLVDTLQARRFDLLLANDIETLPLAFALAKQHNTPVLFDAHEYAPRHFENLRSWRIFFQRFNIYLCKKYIPAVKGMITVGHRIAEEYEKQFGILPVVITNAPARQSSSPTAVTHPIRLVHHGIGTPSRKIELMIRMMDYLPDHFTLDLILLSPPSASHATRQYLEDLKTNTRHPRITFKPPVGIHDIPALINQYDLGIILIPPVNFNYENGLPNKFFDYIQNSVALAIGPTPEMAAIVRQYELGVVSHDFEPESLAAAIRVLTPEQIQSFKNHTAEAAALYCAENNETTLLKLASSLTHH